MQDESTLSTDLFQEIADSTDCGPDGFAERLIAGLGAGPRGFIPMDPMGKLATVQSAFERIHELCSDAAYDGLLALLAVRLIQVAPRAGMEGHLSLSLELSIQLDKEGLGGSYKELVQAVEDFSVYVNAYAATTAGATRVTPT